MISDVLNERENQYGDFATLASMAQSLKRIFRGAPSANMLTDIQVEALENIAVKLARLLNGDPMLPDNWQDIAGYASLAHEALVAAALPPAEPVKAPRIEPITPPGNYAKVDQAAKALLDTEPLPVFLTNGNHKKDKSL